MPPNTPVLGSMPDSPDQLALLELSADWSLDDPRWAVSDSDDMSVTEWHTDSEDEPERAHEWNEDNEDAETLVGDDFAGDLTIDNSEVRPLDLPPPSSPLNEGWDSGNSAMHAWDSSSGADAPSGSDSDGEDHDGGSQQLARSTRAEVETDVKESREVKADDDGYLAGDEMAPTHRGWKRQAKEDEEDGDHEDGRNVNRRRGSDGKSRD